jgi:hypothetical protein
MKQMRALMSVTGPSLSIYAQVEHPHVLATMVHHGCNLFTGIDVGLLSRATCWWT